METALLGRTPTCEALGRFLGGSMAASGVRAGRRARDRKSARWRAATDVAKRRGSRAMRLIGAASASREYGGASLAIPFEREWHERVATAVRRHLREDQARVAFEEGRALSVEQALDYALEPSV